MIEFKNKDYLYVHYIEDWTKPFYVGIGKNYRATCFSRRGRYWENYVKKHGTPKVKIIQYFDNAEQSKIAEKALIGFFGRRINQTGALVNFSLGGDGIAGRIGRLHPMYGKHMSEESKLKSSNKLKGLLVGERNGMYGKFGALNPFYGKKHTEESKEFQRLLKTGTAKGENNPFYGKKHTEETKLLLSKKKKGSSMNEETRKKVSETLRKIRQASPEKWSTIDPIHFGRSILLFDIETGVYYYSYDDAKKYYPYSRHILKKMIDGVIPNKTNLTLA